LGADLKTLDFPAKDGSGPCAGRPLKASGFEVTTFPQFNEPPAYFKKEFVQSSDEMSYASWNGTSRICSKAARRRAAARAAAQKLAYPLIPGYGRCLAIPFSLSTGRRSTLTGAAGLWDCRGLHPEGQHV